MTTFVAEFSSPLGWVRANAAPRPTPGPRPAFSVPASEIPAALGSSARVGGEAERAYIPASPPGVIGAAVIRAARHSAGLPRRRLAQTLSVSHGTALAWEDGTTPLFCVPYDQLRTLANALTDAGAQVGWELDELLIASQCDLLVTGMLCGFEDYAEVPPVEGDSTEAWAARGLLRWALTGMVPMRYRLYASSNPLMARSDVEQFAALAQELQMGLIGSGLKGFGHTLAELFKDVDKVI